MWFFAEETEPNISENADVKGDGGDEHSDNRGWLRSLQYTDRDGKIRIKCFHELWEEYEAEFICLGVSSDDVWSLPPSTIYKIAKLKREEKQAEVEEKLELSRITALLTAVGINDPKKFPKSMLKDKEVVIEDDIDEQAKMLMRFKEKYK